MVRKPTRLRGIEELEQVHRAYLEPNGMISVVPVDDAESTDPPATPIPD